MDEIEPVTEPSGALVPPPRVPPTAIAAATPMPPTPPRPPRAALRSSHTSRSVYIGGDLRGAIASAVSLALDTADILADAVAERLGLRA